MKLSVPFIPDETYISFLNREEQSIESIYFPLYSGPVLDARTRFLQADFKTLLKNLKTLGPFKKYCLLNSRFIDPAFYHDPDFLNTVLTHLSDLSTHAGINGFVFSDAYLLTALAGRRHPIISDLEAVPGVNCMIDSFEKVESFLEIIETAGFKPPGKIILDRSLNRDIKKLLRISRVIEKNHPSIGIELLANEGCIYHCPYKLAHDSQISFSNTGKNRDMNFLTNQAIGCHAYYTRQPERFLKSPFIRPEDMTAYSSCVNSIKLCGRTLGIHFMTQCINAYIKHTYTGNLLDLMDAAHWLSDHYHIDNKRLDPGFLNMITQCTKICRGCNLCNDVWQNSARRKASGLKQYKDYQ